jgi:hypothetical protein
MKRGDGWHRRNRLREFIAGVIALRKTDSLPTAMVGAEDIGAVAILYQRQYGVRQVEKQRNAENANHAA